MCAPLPQLAALRFFSFHVSRASAHIIALTVAARKHAPRLNHGRDSMTMTTPDGAQRGSPLAKHSPAANVVESATTQDVWLELFATVSALSETVDTASQAFGSDGDKVG